MKWADILWDQGKIVVPRPKTEHHEGKESRMVPIFPELLPYLKQAFEEAENKTGLVITRYRSTEANLRTQFRRIVEMASLTPWPKIFHNLRASRETELAAEYPIQVVCAWIGNSPTIAARHYLTVTDSDFRKASSPDAHHFAHQNMTESGEIGGSRSEAPEKKSRRKRGEGSVSRKKEGKESGRYRTRTCDLFRVKEAR